MSTASSDSINAVFEQVRGWPEDQQVLLASRILESLRRDDATPRKKTLGDLLGLLATDEPPPTDEEVDQWLEEERLRKFG